MKNLKLTVTCWIEAGHLVKSSLKKSDNFKIKFIGQECPMVRRWLEEYSQGQQPTVELSLKINDLPPFTSHVLEVLSDLPFGETTSYQQLAVRSASPRAARAIGNACGKNPLPLFIPCHRVLRADGSIGGFSQDPRVKRLLLEFESVLAR
jgi:methylated-DNA-[protein]-cysteine S-methyltransferase